MAFILQLQVFLGCIVALAAATMAAPKSGSTIHLVHRDSPLSPLHKPGETTYERLRRAHLRSTSRLNRFRTASLGGDTSVQSDVIQGGGEYVMSLTIGTPPVKSMLIADTGSDLNWVQCKPCVHCYQQVEPIYDPSKSSTYKNILCSSKPCYWLGDQRSECSNGTCEYSYAYGDNSYTEGHLGAEKMAFLGTTSTGTHASYIPYNVVFGCGTNNAGTFGNMDSGLIGLGGGHLSLVSQLSKLYSGKFSYCLVPFAEESKHITSEIQFGDDNSSSSMKQATTPLIRKHPDTFYYVTLEAISVGKKRLEYKPSLNYNSEVREDGNIIIDSGTTLTFLDSEFFYKMEEAVNETVHATPERDPGGLFRNCYKVNDKLNLPIITAHFTNLDVELQPLNTFVTIEGGLACLAILPADEIAIVGNIAQGNFNVGYDLHKRTVSFTPTDCSKK